MSSGLLNVMAKLVKPSAVVPPAAGMVPSETTVGGVLSAELPWNSNAPMSKSVSPGEGVQSRASALFRLALPLSADSTAVRPLPAPIPITGM